MPGRAPIVLLLVLAGLVVAGGIGFQKKGTSELPVYTTGGARMAAGEEIYRPFPADQKPFTYPPFFAVPFVPLSSLPQPAHRLTWYGINLLVLGGILWAMSRWRRACAGPGRGAALFWVLVLAVSARHLASTFENQSHDLLVFGAMVAATAAWRRERDFATGGWLGLAAACKATPLFGVLPLLGRLRPGAILALLVALLAATLLPDLLFPRQDGQWWAAAWYATFLSGLEVGGAAGGGTAWDSHSYLNQSLAGTLTRLLVPHQSDSPFFVGGCLLPVGAAAARWITLSLQGAMAALVLLISWRRRRVSGDTFARWGELGLVLCGMVLLSPMSSKSHFCVLLLPVGFCVAHLLYRRRDPLVWALLAAAFSLGTLTVKGLVGREFGNVCLAYGSVTWTTLAVFLATAHVLWWEDRSQLSSTVSSTR